MSAADIGRRKIEEREAEYVAVGDVILDEHGAEAVVTHLGDRKKRGRVRLVGESVHGKGSGLLKFRPDEKVRVRR